MMRRVLVSLVFSTMLSAFALPYAAHAQDNTMPIHTGLFSNTAVGGYDTVAYHTQGEAIEGSRDFSTEWHGAEWRFSSQANLDTFLADPDRYAPAYGGYCAFAMAHGAGAKGDPEVWDIVEGRLYLNYSRNVQTQWHEDVPGFIEQADENYPHVLND